MFTQVGTQGSNSITSTFYLQIKAEMLTPCLIVIFWLCQMFSDYSKNKALGFAVLIIAGYAFMHHVCCLGWFDANLHAMWWRVKMWNSNRRAYCRLHVRIRNVFEDATAQIYATALSRVPKLFSMYYKTVSKPIWPQMHQQNIVIPRETKMLMQCFWLFNNK